MPIAEVSRIAPALDMEREGRRQDHRQLGPLLFDLAVLGFADGYSPSNSSAGIVRGFFVLHQCGR
jgi:hypothetical protein